MGNPWALTEWQKEIDSYLIGTTRLYGFVTPKQFLLVFNRYHEQKLLKSKLMKYANKLVRQSRNYYIYDNAIICLQTLHKGCLRFFVVHGTTLEPGDERRMGIAARDDSHKIVPHFI